MEKKNWWTANGSPGVMKKGVFETGSLYKQLQGVFEGIWVSPKVTRLLLHCWCTYPPGLKYYYPDVFCAALVE